MFKKAISKSKYDGMGFVEALLAIVVAGIASVLLMGIAVDSISQVVKNEISDEMTQVAIEGAAQVKTIAEKNNTSNETLFPPINGNVNSCFAITGSASAPSFDSNSSGFVSMCNYDAGERQNCKGAVSATNSDLFQVFCITAQSDISKGLVVGKMVVGRKDCASSQDCNAPDYEYYVITKTVQK